MIRLSAQTAYALSAMMDLAKHPTERTTFLAIGERQGIPHKFLPTVLLPLIQAKLVHSMRGHSGGVLLRGDPKDITLRQIIESIDGPQQLYDCDSRGNDCTRITDCQLRNVLERSCNAMLAVLEATTLADLISDTCDEKETAEVVNK